MPDTVRELIGVYDADGTLLGEARYWIGARLGQTHRALCDIDGAHRKSPGVLTEIPHLMAGSVYRLAGAGGGSAEAVGCGMVIA